MKLKTASLIAAIGCTALLVILIFMNSWDITSSNLALRKMIYIAGLVLGWGSLANFFLTLYKNQK
jgi:hypothetical protein